MRTAAVAMRGTDTRNVRRRRTRPTEAGSQGKRNWGAMRRDVARSLKVGLRDEIDRVKETKISLSFQILDCETARTRTRAPNPANRQDLPPTGEGFAPTNGLRRPAGRRRKYPNNPNKLSPGPTCAYPPSSRPPLHLGVETLRPTPIDASRRGLLLQARDVSWDERCRHASRLRSDRSGHSPRSQSHCSPG